MSVQCVASLLVCNDIRTKPEPCPGIFGMVTNVEELV